MKRLSSKAKAKFGVVVVGVVTGSTFANAAITLPTDISVSPVEAFAGIILIAIAAIWPVKKLIAMGNKS